ncbi:Major Facilitator Superfamily protein [Posidoniimonas polymericola]|uniref:Major Facilitator Superfamily protein n=1 Tax=Posidoniimonas polymericola TaxID=2528002 RepID=A0A5C5YS66_9BACT|nr:MFS transporter [Posidoniimonas polymericola]TWT77728.1 Major Facilitator Superfamily protein [Posidoniimonas polymericola]
MSRLADELPLNEQPYEPFDQSEDAAADPPSHRELYEARNFFWLMLHQVLLRIGWIFKTESIVMPMFLSMIGGSSLMIGLLPVLNRLGFSVPPLLYAQPLKLSPLKQRMVARSSLLMAAPFAVLSAVWFSGAWQTTGGSAAWWMPWLFLAVYGWFFCLTGVNQLGMHALHGKLIRADLRGRLYTAAVIVGAPVAVVSAWLLLPGWLKLPDGGFGWIFGFTALAFLASGSMLLFTREAPDRLTEPPTKPLQKFVDAWRVVRDDPRARPVAILSGLVCFNFMLFPHYQSLYPRRPGGTVVDYLGEIMLWVCVQNAATAVVSLVAGPLADWMGNRAALRCSTLGLASGPLIALLLAQASPEAAREQFYLVFMPLGFMPVTIKLLMNYTLEAAPDDDHPQYVAAIGMCIAMPVIVGAPVVGYLVGRFGAAPVFIGGLAVLLLAFLQSLRLPEPRHG